MKCDIWGKSHNIYKEIESGIGYVIGTGIWRIFKYKCEWKCWMVFYINKKV